MAPGRRFPSTVRGTIGSPSAATCSLLLLSLPSSRLHRHVLLLHLLLDSLLRRWLQLLRLVGGHRGLLGGCSLFELSLLLPALHPRTAAPSQSPLLLGSAGVGGGGGVAAARLGFLFALGLLEAGTRIEGRVREIPVPVKGD
ncbi:hypothetical protein PR202_gb06894 [Eleusine coracana subsp. coracana]|uniref:Uncharacterized protein n=1 Tax=Eleusine coracana subsp. coracana TaxID=191504 RepID=A0AAV5EAL8_ELECO|nr:hypothetical protein PR202_gb06894 [Eleusine coracana subsp. coracana]